MAELAVFDRVPPMADEATVEKAPRSKLFGVMSRK